MIKEFDVHFEITGFYKVDAVNNTKAREKVERIIADSIKEIEYILCTGVKDDSYTTDVIETRGG